MSTVFTEAYDVSIKSVEEDQRGGFNVVGTLVPTELAITDIELDGHAIGVSYTFDGAVGSIELYTREAVTPESVFTVYLA